MRKNNNQYIEVEELQRQHEILKSISSQWTDEFIINHGRKPLFCIETYGCQMNERDSEHLKGMLHVAGFEQGENAAADLILFNTCCIRDHAEQRVFGNIGALRKRKALNPDMIIGVCGCMMQQEDTAKSVFSRFPFVDMVFGTHSLHAFAQTLYDALNSKRVFDVRQSDGQIAENLPTQRDDSTSAFVTIMYGCDNFCTYCIVPFVRGRERSRDPQHIIDEVRELIGEGVKEITLLGQNVNSYGKDSGEINFAELLRRIDDIADGTRIRFMTSHPKDLSSDLIDAMAQCKNVSKHIHLPVQSGSDDVLKRMNRKYTRAMYFALIEELRAKIPQIEITTDFIVGFPGESEQDFCDTLDLIDKIGFSAAYTFMFSPRKGTAAAGMNDQIDAQIKKERLQRLNSLQEIKSAQNSEKYIGKTLRVLVEGCEPRCFGKSDNFKTVFFDGDGVLKGTYVDVLVEKRVNSTLYGKIII